MPNSWLLLALMLGTVLLAADRLTNPGAVASWSTWTHLAGLAAALIALLPFYALGWMGAGDVKFYATLGFLLGMEALLPIWIISALLGGMQLVAGLLWRWGLRHVAGSMHMRMAASAPARWLQSGRQGRPGTPFASYLALGALTFIAAPGFCHRWLP
ncbi:prepilin peptidase [Dyella sp.]|uniref:prepilin peptidase n=1 Tax=Dyella sp. TaxID=1869338 RepID=UPI003F7D1998